MPLSAFLLAATMAAPSPAALTVTLGQARTLQGIRVMALAPAPTGSKIAATLESGEIRIINAIDGTTIKKIAWNQPSYGIAWNPAGTQIVTGDESGRIVFWNVSSGKKVKEIRPHTKGVQFITYNSKGNKVMSTGKEDLIKIVDVRSGKVDQTILGKGANLYSATYLSSGYVVGTLGYCPQVRRGIAQYRLQGHKDASAFDVDYNKATNRILSAGRDGTAILWSVIGAKLAALKGHQDWVQHCRFSPNGRFAATSSIDRTVRFFNLTTYQCEATLQDQSAIGSPICFTSDGKYLVTADASDYLQIRAITPPQGAGGGKRRR